MTHAEWRDGSMGTPGTRGASGGGYQGFAEKTGTGYKPRRRPDYYIDPAEMYALRRNTPAGVQQQLVDIQRRRQKKEDLGIRDRHWTDTEEFSPEQQSAAAERDMWGISAEEGIQKGTRLKKPSWFTGGTPKAGFFTGNPKRTTTAGDAERRFGRRQFGDEGLKLGR